MQQVLDDTNNIASLPYISTDKRDQFSDLFILNPISSKITPLMNILKTDYIIQTKIIENTENRNMDSNSNNSNNSNSNNSNNNNNLSDPGDIYHEICRTSVCRLLQGREGGHKEMTYPHSHEQWKQEIAISPNGTTKNLGRGAEKDHLTVNCPSRRWSNWRDIQNLRLPGIKTSAGVISGAAISIAAIAGVEGAAESLALGDDSSVDDEAEVEE